MEAGGWTVFHRVDCSAELIPSSDEGCIVIRFSGYLEQAGRTAAEKSREDRPSGTPRQFDSTFYEMECHIVCSTCYIVEFIKKYFDW